MSATQSHRDIQAKASRAAALQERSIRRPARLGPSVRSGDSASPDNNRKARRFSLLQCLFLVLQIAVLLTIVFSIFRLREHTQPVQLELRYLIPGQEDIVESVPYGEPVLLHDPVELEGYTFLCWEDQDGSPETRSAFPLLRSTYYTARYALTFETEKHIPYLCPDSDGVLNVDDPVTIREAVNTLYLLLDIDLVGEGTFSDVPEKDSCRKAAATLKDLGVLSGDRLYPDDALSRVELLRMLSCFYPASQAELPFRDLDPDDAFYPVFCCAAERGWIESGEDIDAAPAELLSRGEFARIINRVLGRSDLQRPADSAVGTIVDVPPSHPYYEDIIEAVIPHEYEMSEAQEIWTSSKALPTHAPGVFFAGVRMHWIREDGTPVVDTRKDGRYFNTSGELSTGDSELDHMLWALLEQTVDPEVMTQEEMLSVLYTYLCSSFSPRDGYVYPKEADSWVIPEAKRLLLEGGGNSYSFAAAFYELAYLIGVPDVSPFSGVIYGKQAEFRSPDGSWVEASAGYTPHGWVEIVIGGISYIFDPGVDAITGGNTMYKRNDPVRWQNGYRTW